MAPITDLTPFNSIERNERIALSVAEQSMLGIRMVMVVVVKTRRSVAASEHRSIVWTKAVDKIRRGFLTPQPQPSTRANPLSPCGDTRSYEIIVYKS